MKNKEIGQILSVEKLCAKCIEECGKIEPEWYYIDGQLYKHKHKTSKKENEK